MFETRRAFAILGNRASSLGAWYLMRPVASGLLATLKEPQHEGTKSKKSRRARLLHAGADNGAVPVLGVYPQPVLNR